MLNVSLLSESSRSTLIMPVAAVYINYFYSKLNGSGSFARGSLYGFPPESSSCPRSAQIDQEMDHRTEKQYASRLMSGRERHRNKVKKCRYAQ